MIQIEKHSSDFGDNTTSIRQIAILLHTLPQRTHRVLLGQLGDDPKQCIAKELLALGEIDALEQYRVLKRMHDALQQETTSARKVESEIQDEIQIGRARVSKKRSSPIYRADESNPDSVGGKTAAALPGGPAGNHSVPLSGETNQPNNRSPQEHPFQTQTDVVTGQAAMPPTPEVLQSIFAQFHQTQAAGVLPAVAIHKATGIQPSVGQDVSHNSQRRNDERRSVLPINTSVNASASSSPEKSTIDREAEASELAQRVDRFLVELPPQTLCRALGMATTKQAFLVLCGLPNETAETILDMLPRRQSRKVRSDMRRMGQLQLSDIDKAKQAVTEIAIRMAAPPTSFAA